MQVHLAEHRLHLQGARPLHPRDRWSPGPGDVGEKGTPPGRWRHSGSPGLTEGPTGHAGGNDADAVLVPPAPASASGSPNATGGEPRTSVAPTSNLFHLVDDMDHADSSLPAVPAGTSAFFWHSRTSNGLGNWFVTSAERSLGDARIDDIVPPRGDSKKACHVTGSKLAGGVDMWAQLDHPSSRPIDLKAYAGVAFWARLDSPSGRFIVAINDHQPGTFFDGEVGKSPWLAQRLAVSDSQWHRFVLLFDDFRQGGANANSTGHALDASAVVGIDFVVGASGESFDLWIDDLALLCRGTCP